MHAILRAFLVLTLAITTFGASAQAYKGADLVPLLSSAAAERILGSEKALDIIAALAGKNAAESLRLGSASARRTAILSVIAQERNLEARTRLETAISNIFSAAEANVNGVIKTELQEIAAVRAQATLTDSQAAAQAANVKKRASVPITKFAPDAPAEVRGANAVVEGTRVALVKRGEFTAGEINEFTKVANENLDLVGADLPQCAEKLQSLAIKNYVGNFVGSLRGSGRSVSERFNALVGGFSAKFGETAEAAKTRICTITDRVGAACKMFSAAFAPQCAR